METKIPFYNIINMLLTGLISIGCCLLLFPQLIIDILSSDIISDCKSGFEIIVVVCFFAVAYEAGLVINRIGSILIEPLLRLIRLLPPKVSYIAYNQAREKYSILPTLAREYALSRTSVALFLILSITSIAVRNWTLLILFLSIMTIFYFSCAKHSNKIVILTTAPQDAKDRDSKPA